VSFEEITDVEFLTLTDAEIDAYLTLTNPLDKAGAYGIQDYGERIVKGICGSLHNVIGLPTERLGRELAAWQYLAGLATV
jgi:septum formation protein